MQLKSRPRLLLLVTKLVPKIAGSAVVAPRTAGELPIDAPLQGGVGVSTARQ